MLGEGVQKAGWRSAGPLHCPGPREACLWVGTGDVDLALESHPKFPASILKDSFLLFSPMPGCPAQPSRRGTVGKKTSAFVRAAQGTNDWSKSTERGKADPSLTDPLFTSGASISSRGPCQPGQMMLGLRHLRDPSTGHSLGTYRQAPG